MLELKTGYKLKALQSDNGEEYLSSTFVQYLRTNGIEHRLSYPYTHQKNGCAERKHRHIIETSLSLLATAFLLLKFWDLTFLAATYLINRLPSPNTNHNSPFELLLHQKPDYTFLKILGCCCYPYIKPYNPHKLEYKSQPCVFSGLCF